MLKFWAFLLLSFSVYSQENLSVLARSSADHQILQRAHYDLSYNDQHEVANWVAYILDHSKLKSCVSRTNNFRPDPDVLNGSAAMADYTGSGYDRGHLVPAGDMKFDRAAMSSTFLLSNMTPQPSRFNRGSWGSLEILIRAWALKYKKIWVVTGPILRPDLATIGKVNKISVPVEYFKVILRYDSGVWKGIGFIMSTDVPFIDLSSYAVSIDAVEDLSGIDFFPTMVDSTEDEVEASADISDWDFGARASYLPCSS